VLLLTHSKPLANSFIPEICRPLLFGKSSLLITANHYNFDLLISGLLLQSSCKPGSTMLTIPIAESPSAKLSAAAAKANRFQSIDLLRGIVMIIMALDHVRDYFHRDAFLYNPTDLSQTTVAVFFTRFVTHYCAPVFMFLAGISAFLYGKRKSRRELSFFLFTRGLWLVIAEISIITLAWTFNPTWHFIFLQIIFDFGISMITLSVLVYLDGRFILFFGILLIACHNLLDGLHVAGNGLDAFLWAILHEAKYFTFGYFTVRVHFPSLPWIGIMTVGYYLGRLYAPGYDAVKRKKTLIILGIGSFTLFILLRSFNLYGDPTPWTAQKNQVFTFLSFINVTKYPPSLFYTLITLGPALIFLALTENLGNWFTRKVQIYGKVPMFYYIAHLYLIHALALIAAVISGHRWTDMILRNRVNATPELKGYGFNLLTVYIIWIAITILLYPLCKWFGTYKSKNLPRSRWLSYI